MSQPAKLDKRWTEYINNLTAAEKCNRVAPYLSCVEAGCNCDGFKHFVGPHDRPGADSPCSGCSHTTQAHGGLTALSQPELDRLTVIAVFIDQLLLRRTISDASEIQQIHQQIRLLRPELVPGGKTFAPPREIPPPGPEPYHPPDQDQELVMILSKADVNNPPFEVPVMSQIFKNFETHKYGSSPEVFPRMQKITAMIMQTMNKNTFLLPYQAHLHPLNYERWVKMCNIGVKIEEDEGSSKRAAGKATIRRYNFTDMFGRSVLTPLLKFVKESLDRYDDLGKEGLTLLAMSYFKDLERELTNLASPIFTMHLTPNNTGSIGERTTGKRKHTAMASGSRAIMDGLAPTVSSQPFEYSQHMQVDLPPLPTPAPAPDAPVAPTSTTRDEAARQEERKGVLNFRLITNDGSRGSHMWLVGLRSIFSKQLPKMPREYIARLMFNRDHRSLVILKNNTPIGGICFRTFRKHGFIEIAFCAITSSEQVKGYGTHLMNHLKDAMQKDRLYYFLTYADNFAVGYFKKQGFTKELSLPGERWKGHIKDYDGGTIMECVIQPNIPYLDVPGMVRRQREAVMAKLKEISNSHVVHPGLEIFKHSNGPGRSIAVEQIPGIKASGWNPAMSSAAGIGSAADHRASLHKWLKEVLDLVRAHPSAWPFHEPVDTVEVYDYLNVIKDPIDLRTIGERLETGEYYITKEIFFADLKRMVENCR
eukprot:TRINITY_DN4279_c0_g1_i8.p1 TRINITY_DN4279_c0_g1~~TRINITY_DN4279_c0_g1_i8.p1  ORF type:complete len:714 (+),score=163.01 TRINITY_DN4279_c0_g1_i8:30-2144(+)